MKRFTLTDDHLTLLRAANVRWQEGDGGAPGIDCKRPYGNSGPPEWDVADKLGWELPVDQFDDTYLTKEQADRASELHRETEHALAILCDLAVGLLTPGEFAYDPSPGGLGWFRVDPEIGAEGTLAWLKEPL